MTTREAKILALTYLSEWAWDNSTPSSCKDMTAGADEARKLANAFETLSLELQSRLKKLERRQA